MASNADFVMEGGILKRYRGKGGRVVIPSAVKVIGDGAFFGYGGLITALEFPDGLRWIGDDAFSTGFMHDGIEALRLPPGLKGIGRRAFSGNYNLKSVWMPKGLRVIGKEAFSQCDALEHVRLPEGLEEIDSSAFWSCRNLSRVKFPESLRKIGVGAFSNCGRLQEIHLPRNLREIEANAFAHCINVKRFTVDAENPAFRGDGCFLLTGDGRRLLCAPGAEGRAVIPEGVTEIEDWAFADNRGITEIVFPDTLEGIGSRAFEDCRNLTALTFPASLKRIGAWAFSSCEKLAGVAFPEKLEQIDECAFVNCPLENVFLPRGVRSLGRMALSFRKMEHFSVDPDNPALRMIDGLMIADGGERLVAAQRDVQNAVIPEGVKIIDENAFYENPFQGEHRLTRVVFPKSLERIGRSAFDSCEALTELSFPENLKTIKSFAFVGCKNLARLTFFGTPEKIDGSFFQSGVKEVSTPPGNRKFWHESFENWGDIQWGRSRVPSPSTEEHIKSADA